MAKPKFLVDVRCFTFNQSKYITDTMNGFCMQETNFPFVCLIVDDASTDGEQEVISKYIEENFDLSENSDSYVKDTEYAHIIYAQHKNNRNCFFVVMFLKENHYSMQKDKFHYIDEWRKNCKYEALCEGDDYWIIHTKLKKQIECMESNRNIMLTYTDAYTVNESGKIISVPQYEVYSQMGKSGNLFKQLLIGNFIYTASICYRKTDDFQAIVNESNFKLDYLYSLTASALGEVQYFKEKTCAYRINSKGMMKTNYQKVSLITFEIKKYIINLYITRRIYNTSFIERSKMTLFLLKLLVGHFIRFKDTEYLKFFVELLIGRIVRLK